MGKELSAAGEEKTASSRETEQERPEVVRKHSFVSILGTNRANRRGKM